MCYIYPLFIQLYPLRDETLGERQCTALAGGHTMAGVCVCVTGFSLFCRFMYIFIVKMYVM